MPPPTPPSAAEIDALLAEAKHQHYPRADGIVCDRCKWEWPCDAHKLMAALRAQSDELRGLRHDKERIDWLEHRRGWICPDEHRPTHRGNTFILRDAIDKVRGIIDSAASTSAGREGDGT